MFLYNYGACALFLKEKTKGNIDDFRYSVKDNTVSLEEYISPFTTVIVPSSTVGLGV